ncbi:hypothetical protein HDV05_003598 [Chytridiales sp. JEL 0842]|nr:hypothetical protein HDV05_003598 [Chytridiales sp. JEL 0842]
MRLLALTVFTAQGLDSTLPNTFVSSSLTVWVPFMINEVAPHFFYLKEREPPTFTMEAYRRVQTGDQSEPIPTPSDASLTLKILSSGKIKDYVTKALAELSNKPGARVVIFAKGKEINKAITVAEITKRQSSVQLEQETGIARVEAEDVWQPQQEDLDKIVVKRSVPCISITLKPLQKSD